MVRYIEKLCIIMFVTLPLYVLFRVLQVRKSAGKYKRAGNIERTELTVGAEKAQIPGDVNIPEQSVMVRKSLAVREFVLGCFVLFHTGLLALALEGEYGSPAQMAERAAERIATRIGINLVPFRSIAAFFVHFSRDVFLVNIVGNVIMFMPWGFGLVMLWKRNRNICSVVKYSVLLPLLIETSQLFIGRSVDVDDLILNFTGSCLGAGIYFLLKKKCGSGSCG